MLTISGRPQLLRRRLGEPPDAGRGSAPARGAGPAGVPQRAL